jgi:C4-dicarboxylate transporter DctM subunit
MSGLVLIGMLMLIVMLFAIFIGFPISFTLLFLALTFGYFGLGDTVFSLAYFQTIGMMKEELLAAVPLFIFMGFITEQAGLMERLFSAFRMLLAPVRGALFLVVIVTSAVFAMATGIVGAAVTVLGIMASPIMIKTGYDAKLSAGAITAGGTLGILIPPSVNMIVYGSLTNNSIGKLFIAGIIPGLLLTACFMLWIYISSVTGGNAIREEKVPLAERVRTLVHLVPPLVVFGIVMGSLYFGIATAAESAALGVIAALAFTWQSGKLNLELLRTCFISTARISGMILLIITAAFILNLAISLTGVAEAMTKWVAGLGLSATGLILALIVFYLILGMFMDVLSMQVATIPITYPIAVALGVDPIWFGIFIVLMCELGLITPPVGMNLFVVHGIRPDKGGIEDAIWGALPYAAIMILFTLLLMAVPQLVTWLPAHM